MFIPNQQILDNYAKVLINFALNSGEGIKKNEVVYFVFDTSALPLAMAIQKAVIRAGGHLITKMTDEEFSVQSLKEMSLEQAGFAPTKYYKGLIDSIDHYVAILGDRDPMFLKNIDPAKLIAGQKSKRMLRKWMDAKEDLGKFTWTLALNATEGQAKEAGITLEEYWQEIIKACFLDFEDPISKWKEVTTLQQETKDWLNSLGIVSLNIKSEGTDLNLTMGEKRKFIGGSGRNIPSFELFTSPDWRGTHGVISFDMPLYRYGQLIKDIKLTFKNGVIVEATASTNEQLLKELIKQKNADKIGEFSLTDRRFSRIDKFMAETLYDENYGGEFGNTHLAVGKSYHDTFVGDAKDVKNSEWKAMGFNESVEHTDIIATKNRVVTATLKNGSSKVIYKDGMFTL